MKKLLIIVFISSFSIFSQEKLKTFTFEEIEKIQEENPKSIFVFVTTDWCKICFGMKQTTFKNEQVIKLLNTHFYYIELNAESKKDIYFLGKTFQNTTSGNQNGIHKLATTLARKNRQVVYPTSVILNQKFEIDLQIQGHISESKMIQLLDKYLEIKP